jgi:hypothetical protein
MEFPPSRRYFRVNKPALRTLAMSSISAGASAIPAIAVKRPVKIHVRSRV